MFVDEIKIYARAGHGGKGCIAFQREKYRPKGGPSGGNGGRGGDVILEANHDLNNLIAQFYQPRLIAQDGQFGLGKGMDGHAGKDLVVKVPRGTLVWRLDSGIGPEDARASAREEFERQSHRRRTLRPLPKRESRGEGERDIASRTVAAPPGASGPAPAHPIGPARKARRSRASVT